jgi:TetR/AcrR family transcriptional regulator, ethionamide resistance regulator
MRPGQLRSSTTKAGTAETRLLEGTERLLARVPLRDLSVEDILAESSVSRRTFYVHFASKYGVIVRLADDALGSIFENLGPLLERGEDEHGPDALRRVIGAGTAIWAEHRDLLRAVYEHWQEVEDLREVWLGTFKRMADALALEIERERTAGFAPPGPDAQTLAASLLWATAGVLHTAWLGDVDELSGRPAEVTDAVTTMWVGAVYGVTPAS